MFCGIGLPLSAQEPDSSSSTEQPPVFGVGISGGAASFPSGSSSQVGALTLQYSPLSWLTFSTSPGFARATDSTGKFVSTGITDLPVSAGLSHTFNGGWSPTIGLSLGVTLPVGDTATGFGNGSTSFGGSLGISASPTERLHLSLGAGRGLSGFSSGSTFAAGSTTSVSAEASTDVGDRTTIGLSYGEDFGTSASEPLARVIGGGISYAVAGPLSVNLDGSHGFGAESAKWVVSLGVGTVFAGISPINPTTTLKRLRAVFGGNGIGSSKRSKVASAAVSCRARRCR
jgi:Putative MetA-pathway of phenol degradation